MRAFQAISLLLSISFAAAAPAPQDAAAANSGTTCTTGISDSRRAQVQSAFTASGVVPTLIPSINPTVDVRVSYGGKAVNLGNSFTTAVLVDPDVPSPSAGLLRMTFLHWQVSGAKSICARSQSPRTVALYQPLTPLSTEQHRYTFLVYREPAGYTPEIITPQVRTGFDVNAYAARGGLTLVGGNFLREAITNGVLPPT